jgi:hypothetical protein
MCRCGALCQRTTFGTLQAALRWTADWAALEPRRLYRCGDRREQRAESARRDRCVSACCSHTSFPLAAWVAQISVTSSALISGSDKELTGLLMTEQVDWERKVEERHEVRPYLGPSDFDPGSDCRARVSAVSAC